ncbi:Sporulation related domain-containing protein [Yoonia rosea]|uniref:Sporulation related domain-containing protein n=1 Tax=Yoonia rosea TaxID=287098 RepID=A0A1R3WP40_9RHOB|nr:SPOR domain-containing protein [Yoonia rosea]SIT79631.1 Sporulation related domain-containing protein [Yoonia rosea]
MAVYDDGFARAASEPRSTSLVNFAGAAFSLALILGVSFWGYKLIVRDVSGIPVVRAMEGDMRVLPDNPGGGVAAHTGLSVNEVAAMGEAGGPEDRLVLAPRTAGLSPEDLDVQPAQEVISTVSAAIEDVTAGFEAEVFENETIAAPEVQDDATALAAQLAALSTEPPLAQAEAAQDPRVVPSTVPGVATSVRPVIRPANMRIPAPVAAATAAPATSEVAVTTATFPVGTNLVQLGAFPNPSLAAAEWDRLQSQFGKLMAGRERVIQVSNQSSATWYRLRASGFEDRAEARRLCAALQAEGAECIAVVVN